jgi:uncharacterized protein
MGELMIAGVDPGTTVGACLLDLNGNLVKVFSYRNISQSFLITEFIKYGKVIILSTDKKFIPEYIRQLSANIGARIIAPKEDLSIHEKANLINGITGLKNNHEKDAYASALMAFRKIKPMINRIDQIIEREHLNDEESVKKTKQLVIQKNFSIMLAIKLITEPDLEENTVIKNLIDTNKIDSNYLKLINKLQLSENTIKHLKHQINDLKNIIILKEKESNKKMDVDKRLGFKESRIVELTSQNNLFERITIDLKKQLNQISETLISGKEFIAVRKIDINNNLNLQLRKDEIVFIKDFSHMKPTQRQILKCFTNTIITENAFKDEFILIDKSKLKVIFETPSILAIDKKSFESNFSSKKLIEKIVEDYKKERSN